MCSWLDVQQDGWNFTVGWYRSSSRARNTERVTWLDEHGRQSGQKKI
jgi:hypothetical protein